MTCSISFGKLANFLVTWRWNTAVLWGIIKTNNSMWSFVRCIKTVPVHISCNRYKIDSLSFCEAQTFPPGFTHVLGKDVFTVAWRIYSWRTNILLQEIFSVAGHICCCWTHLVFQDTITVKRHKARRHKLPKLIIRSSFLVPKSHK